MGETLRVGIVQPYLEWDEHEVAGSETFGFDMDGRVLRGPAFATAFSVHRDGGWMFTLLYGRDVRPRSIDDAKGCFHAKVHHAHVIVEREAPPALDAIERELLGRIARGDGEAVPVLGDHWLGGRDPSRGELLQLGRLAPARARAEERRLVRAHRASWCAPVLASGFTRDDLPFANGFVEMPLAIVEGEPLSRGDAIFRVSPRVYCGRPGHDAVLLAADGELARVLLRGTSRTKAEVDLVRRFDHPNLPRIVDVVAWRGGVALAAAWPGASLRALFPQAGVHVAIALSIAEQLCSGLEVAHALGYMHGDIRTDCVYVSPGGVVTLHDWRRSALSRQTTWTPVDLGCVEHLVTELVQPRALPARLRDLFATDHDSIGELRAGILRVAAVLSLQIGPHVLTGIAHD